ncbi:MAG TPA: ABC transporter permease [Pseudomonadales bacterium]|nr:ABC transporter permease [Pseudomonadales bacterium]
MNDRSSSLGRQLLRAPVALAALLLLLALVTASLAAQWLAPQNPYDPASYDIMDAQIPPLWLAGGDPRFLLGSDGQGRDILSIILHGSRISLLIGLGAVAVQALLGIVIGLCAGYGSRWLDDLLMRLADVQMSISTLMIALVALALAQSLLPAEHYQHHVPLLLILVIRLAEWPQYARTLRAAVLAEKQLAYVEAARLLGFSQRRILLRHLLPNTLSPLLVISTVQVASAIMSEAALSFLGLGMPITRPSLGALINSGFELLLSGAWWISIIPGLTLVLLILCINLLGDWLRDALDPRHGGHAP